MGSGSPVGVDVTLGKTTADSPETLVQRYAVHRQPARGLGGQGARRRRRHGLRRCPARQRHRPGAGRGLDAARPGSVAWQLWRGARSRAGIAAGLAVVLVVVLLWEPWQPEEPSVQAGRTWEDLGVFLDHRFPLPASLPRVQVRTDATVLQSKRLLLSAVATYENSKTFYDKAAAGAAEPAAARAGGGRDASWCWSPTATTTSAWTASPARSATGPAPRRSSTPATTPRPAASGRPSASTPSTRPSRTTTGTPSPATTTTATSSAATSTTWGGTCSRVLSSTGPVTHR